MLGKGFCVWVQAESEIQIAEGEEFLFSKESIDKSKVLWACALFTGIGYAISLYRGNDKAEESYAYLLEDTEEL